MKHIKFYAAGLGIVFAFCSAFTTFHHNAHVRNNQTVFDYWYSYSGDQSVMSRETNTNYTHISSPTCTKSGNECAVEVQSTLSSPPTNPDFTNITFDSNGFPSGGSDFVANDQRQNP